MKKCFKKDTHELRAVKIIRNDDVETLRAIKNEYLMLQDLNHPHIVKVFEMYYNPYASHIHIVMELIQGSDLFEFIRTRGPLSGTLACREMWLESEAQPCFKSILLAVEYLHKKGLCHRDLKPDNILIGCHLPLVHEPNPDLHSESEKEPARPPQSSSDRNQKSGWWVKLTDFGVSKYFWEKERHDVTAQRVKMCTHTGTMAFNAPEVLTQEEYTYLDTVTL